MAQMALQLIVPAGNDAELSVADICERSRKAQQLQRKSPPGRLNALWIHGHSHPDLVVSASDGTAQPQGTRTLAQQLHVQRSKPDSRLRSLGLLDEQIMCITQDS